MAYIWQDRSWPNFTWDAAKLLPLLSSTLRMEAAFIEKMKGLGKKGEELTLEAMADEVISSSAIEGIYFDRSSVRSSILRRLGIETEEIDTSDRHAENAASLLIGALKEKDEKLTEESLLHWQSIICEGRNDNRGRWRTEPVYVISGRYGHERIHFEGVPAANIPDEIRKFLNFVNNDDGTEPFLKAAIAHLWFVTIHPFADGNGRISRTIMELLLARADGTEHRYYSISKAILSNKKDYYDILEKTQSGNLDITEYLIWFFAMLKEAVSASEESLKAALSNTAIWDKLRDISVNEREEKMLRLIIDGFSGKLTAEKWAKITKCSHSTALRDITDLLGKGVLLKERGKTKSASYALAPQYTPWKRS